MVEENSDAPVPIDRVQYAARAAYELLSKHMTREELQAILGKRAGRNVSSGAVETFLAWLQMAPPCLALDLEALAEARAKNT